MPIAEYKDRLMAPIIRTLDTYVIEQRAKEAPCVLRVGLTPDGNEDASYFEQVSLWRDKE